MKNLLHQTVFLLIICSNDAFCTPPSRANIDGTWYTNGQIAYIECSKTSVNVAIDFITNGSSYLKIWVTGTSNFSVSNTASDIQKKLNLDPAKNNGSIDVSFVNSDDYIRIYIQQRPPALTVTGSNLCAGSSSNFTASSNYNFQSTKPMHFVWQTTGGVTVNTSNNYTSPDGLFSTVTIANSSSGTYSVKAVVASCSNLESKTSVDNLGKPVIKNPNYWLFDPGSNMWQFSQEWGSPAVTYSFSVASGSASITQNYGDAYIATSSGATICVNGTNSCGTGASYCFSIPAASGMMRAAYPNPASGVLSLEFGDGKSSDTVPFEVALYSEKSTKAVNSMSADEISTMESYKAKQKIEMDVSRLPRGVYYIHIIPDEKSKLTVQKERIVLE